MPFLGLTRSQKTKKLQTQAKLEAKPKPGFPLPHKFRLPLVRGGEVSIGDAQLGRWQVIVVYRGFHSLQCREYLEKINAAYPEFQRLKCDVVAVSCDSKVTAVQQVEESALDFPVACCMTKHEAYSLGCYVSDPADDYEADRPYAEPAIIVINPDQLVHLVCLTNVDWALPEVSKLLRCVAAHRAQLLQEPIRGTHAHTTAKKITETEIVEARKVVV